MSFVAPTSNIVVISSGDQTIASGTLSIVLNIANEAGFSSNSFTMDVTDIGAMEIDFDYIEEIGDINDFTINVPTFDIEIRDEIKSGSTTESFLDLVTSLDAFDLIVAKITINSRSDYYYTTREQCEFSYIERKVKLNFKHPLKYGAIGFGKTFSLIGKEVDLYLDQDVGADPDDIKQAYFVKDLINQYLLSISESNTVYNYSELYVNEYDTYTSTVSNGETVYLDYSVAAVNFGSATDRMKPIALSEAAIIGNMLGYAFFVPRYSKNTETKVTLTSDDFEELDLDFSYKNVRNYNLNYNLGTDYDYTANVPETNVSVNPLGQNDVTVNFGLIGTTPAIYNTAYNNGINTIAIFLSGDIVDSGGNTVYYNNVTQPSGFSTKILPSWRRLFRIPQNATDDAGIAISGTIFGIETLKPYEYFSIGSGIHPLVDNKDFRPSYLKFNLLDDTIEFEAYEF